MIVIPDVHGRLFWKEAIAQRKPDEKVIFLGDYLDPYVDLDNISPEEALVNFYDIIEYAKENPDTTEMLIGNHDLWYLNPKIQSCRQDKKHLHEIQKIFFDNIDLFKIAYSWKSGRRNYLFTHAGVHKKWLDVLMTEFPKDEETDVADYLNECFKNDRSKFINYLDVIPYKRGGNFSYGSCVWADIEEWYDKYIEFILGYYQVFGHSLCRMALIDKKFAMLDCRDAFRIEKSTIDKITFNYNYKPNK